MKGKYPDYPAEPIADVRDMFLNSTEKFADNIALQQKKRGRWIPITYRSLRTSVEEIACGLAALRLQPVKIKVAIHVAAGAGHDTDRSGGHVSHRLAATLARADEVIVDLVGHGGTVRRERAPVNERSLCFADQAPCIPTCGRRSAPP